MKSESPRMWLGYQCVLKAPHPKDSNVQSDVRTTVVNHSTSLWRNALTFLLVTESWETQVEHKHNHHLFLLMSLKGISIFQDQLKNTLKSNIALLFIHVLELFEEE